MTTLRLAILAILIALAILLGAAAALLPEAISRSVLGSLRLLSCRLGCRLLGISVVSRGARPQGAHVLLVANHVSWTDVLALGSLAPICFLARHDLAGWPVLGALAQVYGTLFVERGRQRQIPAVNKQMAERIEAGEIVALFPEATTSDGTRLRPFSAVHLAAARDLLRRRPDIGQVAVAPVAIAYTHACGLPLGRAGRSRWAWYGDTGFAPHLLDLARSGGITCQVSFLGTVAYDVGAQRKSICRAAEAAIRTETTRLLAGGRDPDA